ncbi:hypothetical protein WA588_002860 [Blastocystis sp. NMH]
MKWKELKRRKEILDHGRDSPFIPSAYYGTVIGYYWKQVLVDGRPTSILHPLIREEIITQISNGRLSWKYLFQDNFLFLASQLCTPVSVVLRCIHHFCISGMTIKPGRHLLDEREIWYRHHLPDIDMTDLSVLSSVNTHQIEFSSCLCYTCYQKSHKREVLKSYWNHVRFRLKSKYRVNYPSLSELSNSDSSLSNLLERESALFFHSTTIFICKEAKESMMELLDSDSWDDQMVVQLFKYARGVSDYENEERRSRNQAIIQRDEEKGRTLFRRLLEKEQRIVGRELYHAFSPQTTPSSH